jgi:hypothetical protein
MSLLGNGESLPFSEARNMELLLLEETKKPSVKKTSSGILSSLFKSVQSKKGWFLLNFIVSHLSNP